MVIFGNCSVVLDVKGLPIKEKKKLKLAITDNGGSIAYVVNKQCTHVITNNLAKLSTNRQRSIHKFQVPVVGVEYVSHCLEKGALLPAKEYSLVTAPSSQTDSSPSPNLQASVFKVTSQTPVGQGSRDQPKPQTPAPVGQGSRDQPKPQPPAPVGQGSRDQPKPQPPAPQQGEKEEERGRKNDGEARMGKYLGSHRVYSESDSDLPTYPSNFEVAKYSIFEKVSSNRQWSVLELQSCRGQAGRQYRVVRYWSEGDGSQATVTRDKLVHCSGSEEALQVYEMLEKELHVQGFKRKDDLPPLPQGLGSSKLHELLLEEKMNRTGISEDVGVFVELLWTEALGCLSDILTIPLNKISLNDVSRAEGLLLQAHKVLKEQTDSNQILHLSNEFIRLLPHKQTPTLTLQVISSKLDLCQLIRDLLQVREAVLWQSASRLGYYRGLRCSIDPVPADSPEFLSVRGLLRDRPVQVHQLFRVSRAAELTAFRGDLGNVRSLLHSSAPRNFVGILSRGLLLPRFGVEHHGIDRTDIGNLGGGIYFSDSLSTSLKYSKPGATDGSRLLLVCDVALGKCQDLRKKNMSLSSAPEGYHSVHGVRCSPKLTSDFEDDEYVVYQTDQVEVKYVVQFSLEDELVKTFQPPLDLSPDRTHTACPSDVLPETEADTVWRNRLEDVTAGLQDSAGEQLPLQAVHVKCKLMDLLTQVIIFQSYTNLSMVPIEAKYVFPLDESAAVCGFEAFINGKHIVGQVKEKEQARREYRQAIEKGHGAYLMDQDAPDVFTISVGNLPPGATVLIKVTYVTELVVRAGALLFSLPGSVAPWQQSKALDQTTQASVEKVCVTEVQEDRVFTLDMSIQMPYEILQLSSVTHRIKSKKTACMAVVSMLPGQTLGPGGFQLSCTLSQVHLPRMWVENHPDKDSQACMLVFYPRFGPSGEADGAGAGAGPGEVVILLDTSESMRGVALQDARRIAVQVLKTLDPEVRVNILSFGTAHKELFPSSQACYKILSVATKYASSSPPVGGSTELWRALRSLSLLPPSRGVRNLLLISDGHVQCEALTLRLVREGICHTRVFTCGVSPTANRHMLRALAQAGGGAYKFFDTKTKHTWVEKVSSQTKRMAGPGCSSVSVKWQQFNPPGAPPPLQAPAQLSALFSDCPTLVYGFVPHCTQATLQGKLSEQELESVVSTSELQKTKGMLLHKLTARAVIRDYEDGSLHADEAEHEGKKEELKSFVIKLSKEYSIVTQYTSFVAIEERDSGSPEAGFTDIPKLLAEEDVDVLSYMGWEGEQDTGEAMEEEEYTPMRRMVVIRGLKGIDTDTGSESDRDTGDTTKDEEDETSYDMAGVMCGLMGIDTDTGSESDRDTGDTTEDEEDETSYDMAGVMCGLMDAEVCSWAREVALDSGVSHHSAGHSPLARRSHLQPPELQGEVECDSVPILEKRPRTSSFAPPLPLSAVPHPPPHYAPAPCPTLHYAVSPFAPPAAAAPPAAPPPAALSLSSAAYNPVKLLLCQHDMQDIPDGSPPCSLMEKLPVISYSPLAPSAPLPYAAAVVPPLPSPKFQVRRVKKKLAITAASPSSPVSPYSPSSCFSRSPLLRERSAMSHSFPAPPPPHPATLANEIPQKYHSIHLEAPPSDSTFSSLSNQIGSSRHLGPMCGPEIQNELFGATGFSFHTATESFSKGLVILDAPGQVPPLQFDRKAGRPRQGSLFSTSPANIDPKAIQMREEITTFFPSSFSHETCSVDRPLQMSWASLFDLQHQDGYWECSEKLGSFLGLDLTFFANVFLKEKGIASLGARARADILKLVATLLVLQMLRLMGLAEGKMLKSLLRLKDSSTPTTLRGQAVKRAVEWVSRADRQYPCVCTRLEFGWDWESGTRQLLGADPLPPHSPLHPVLERTKVLKNREYVFPFLESLSLPQRP
ncbi:protein mono-ADP-ribosyltransferase PARP4 [Conger conger]|uniref:protein mono-ADP-ribosyltransferase PARP4 n=1 Tax=Conger conger TaxID=82655 RepID=UPI002A59E269|nr:protein mono-ADP-ribosyltransferase PARP4 [Conger conger]